MASRIWVMETIGSAALNSARLISPRGHWEGAMVDRPERARTVARIGERHAADRPEPTYRISNRQNRIGTHAGRQPECRLRFLLAGHALEKFSGTVQRRGVLLGA